MTKLDDILRQNRELDAKLSGKPLTYDWKPPSHEVAMWKWLPHIGWLVFILTVIIIRSYWFTQMEQDLSKHAPTATGMVHDAGYRDVRLTKSVVTTYLWWGNPCGAGDSFAFDFTATSVATESKARLVVCCSYDTWGTGTKACTLRRRED